MRAADKRSVRAGLNDEPFLAEVCSPDGVTGLHLSQKLASMGEPLKVLGLQESKATIPNDEFALVKHIDKRHQFTLPNDVEPERDARTENSSSSRDSCRVSTID